MTSIVRVFAVCVMGVLLSGCAQQGQGFKFKDLAKSDTDLMIELHRQQTRMLVHELIIKLYKRNPVQLRTADGKTVAGRIEQLKEHLDKPLEFAELNRQQGIDAMRLGLSPDYAGDRVFAVAVGLIGMLREAYGYKSEFYWLDTLDQQKLYHSARNIEVLVWLIKTSKDEQGERLLLTDGCDNRVCNHSFERIFGKLIAYQDMLALILAGQTQRAINSVAQGVVSMTFIPL